MPVPPSPILPAVNPPAKLCNRESGSFATCLPTLDSAACFICSSSEHLEGTCTSANHTDYDNGRLYREQDFQETEKELIEHHNPTSKYNAQDDRMCELCSSTQHNQTNCPERAESIACYQCHQWGHMMLTCPLTRCYNCGAYGHSSQICYSKSHCFHCSDAGHRAAECPVKYKGRICYQCKEPGHQAANCPQGHLCKMCHLPGHIFAYCPEAICKYCREKGHTTGACMKLYSPSCGSVRPNGNCHNPRRPTNPPLVHANVQLKDISTTKSLPISEDANDNYRNGNYRSSVMRFEPETSTYNKPVSIAERNDKRVLVIIDGLYFERCLKCYYTDPRVREYYTRLSDVLSCTLEYIGVIFDMNPIAYWFDFDPVLLSDSARSDSPSPEKAAALHEFHLRRRFLIPEMNQDRILANVVPRLVGNIKTQRAFTANGTSFVCVETGISVAVAISLIEVFQDRRMCDQIVLLCDESDVYPALTYCNMQQRVSKEHQKHPSVRMCGISISTSEIHAQTQGSSDFLQRIILDKVNHNENGRTYEFPAYKAFGV